ncbi:MAG: DUF1223 domain-containing protein, partial [Acidobacteriota bacterium]
DRLLSRLGRGGGIEGVQVVALSYHVDYWDSIGWKDPFSSAAWSKRQHLYAKAFHLNSIYTPQLVVQGSAEMIGSDEPDVLLEIQRAAGELVDPPSLHLEASPVDSDRIEVTVEVTLAAPLVEDELNVWVALFEEGLETAVGRGENSGRQLHNDFVVRQLQNAITVLPATGERATGSLTLEIEPGWKSEGLGLAAFVQDPTSLRILAASNLRRIGSSTHREASRRAAQ